MAANIKLGMIDWGIGGIGVFKAVKAKFGDTGITYFSDTGATPYGKMERKQLARRLDEVMGFLAAQGVTHIIIACNAASTAIADLTDRGLMVEGVINPAIGLTARLKPTDLGLIAGRRTVVSGVYRKAFTGRGIALKQRIAQPLSGLIESGDISSDILREECRKILSPLKNCSHILLACTHYPAISEIISQFVSPETVLIDPADEIVKTVAKWQPQNGSDVFYTTGTAENMQKAAWNAFGVDIGTIVSITI